MYAQLAMCQTKRFQVCLLSHGGAALAGAAVKYAAATACFVTLGAFCSCCQGHTDTLRFQLAKVRPMSAQNCYLS